MSETKSMPSWLKSGASANQQYQAVVQQQELAKEAASKLRSFFLKEGNEATVTFLDGGLDESGILDRFAFNQHTLQVNGDWKDFICVGESEICPLCNSGDRPNYVSVFTVCNHTPYTIKNGPNQGKVIKDYRQLYVAKLTTFKKLQLLAGKRGGLKGWRIEISRTTAKDARVGDTFQFLDHRTPDELIAEYGDEGKPADYGTELTYLTAKQLLALGVGKAPTGIGYSSKGGVLTEEDIAAKM